MVFLKFDREILSSGVHFVVAVKTSLKAVSKGLSDCHPIFYWAQCCNFKYDMEHCEFVKSPSIRDIFLMQKMYLQNQNSICQKITTYMNLCVFFWTVFLCMFNNYAVKIQHLVRDMNKTKTYTIFFYLI